MYVPIPIVIFLTFSIELFLAVNVLLNAFWGYFPSLLQLLFDMQKHFVFYGESVSSLCEGEVVWVQKEVPGCLFLLKPAPIAA